MEMELDVHELELNLLVALCAAGGPLCRSEMTAKVGKNRELVRNAVARLLDGGFVNCMNKPGGSTGPGRVLQEFSPTAMGIAALDRHLNGDGAGQPDSLGIDLLVPVRITQRSPVGTYTCHELTGPAVRIGADDHMRVPSRVGDQLRYQYQQRHSHGGGASCQH